MPKKMPQHCPCGTGLNLNNCCGQFHQEIAIPDSAVTLMRSRYSAYALGQTAYLQNTWHPTTRPPLETEDDSPSIKWLELVILNHDSQGDEATVSFIATCKISGRLTRLKETSRFVREGGRWWYLDGEIFNA